MTRWITGQIGTSPYYGCEKTSDIILIDVRVLRDAGGNPANVIRAHIDKALAALHKGRRVVVCCDHGVSRSNAIAAGVLAASAGIDYDAAIAQVMATVGELQIKLDFASDVRAALGEPPRRTADSGTFIVGSDGFLGRALRRALGTEESGRESYGSASLVTNPVLLDASLGMISPKRLLFCWHPPQLDTNAAVGALLTGLRNTLEVCRLRHLDFAFISGYQVFLARQDEDVYFCTEDEQLQPAGAAGDGLYLAEQLIRMYASRHKLNTLIIRPTHLYGAGDERPSFLNTFLRKALAGAVIDTHSFANGAPCVDVLHVDDFARGVAMAFRQDLTGVLHLSSGQALTTDALAREIARLAGQGGTTREIKFPGSGTRTLLDTSRARDVLGWRPEISLRDGLRDALSHVDIDRPDS